MDDDVEEAAEDEAEERDERGRHRRHGLITVVTDPVAGS
jgi:hypothetical protein